MYSNVLASEASSMEFYDSVELGELFQLTHKTLSDVEYFFYSFCLGLQ